jgi:hypothetical protein
VEGILIDGALVEGVGGIDGNPAAIYIGPAVAEVHCSIKGHGIAVKSGIAALGEGRIDDDLHVLKGVYAAEGEGGTGGDHDGAADECTGTTAAVVIYRDGHPRGDCDDTVRADDSATIGGSADVGCDGVRCLGFRGKSGAQGQNEHNGVKGRFHKGSFSMDTGYLRL